MERFVSIVEFASKAGKSDTYFRRLCRENKIPHVQEQVENSSSVRYMIDTESEEAQKYLRNVPKQEGGSSAEHSSVNINELIEKIEYLSKEAGKVELLENFETSKDKDIEYWKNLYLEAQHNVAELNGTIGTLSAELKQKETELSELKRPIFKKVFGIK